MDIGREPSGVFEYSVFNVGIRECQHEEFVIPWLAEMPGAGDGTRSHGIW